MPAQTKVAAAAAPDYRIAGRVHIREDGLRYCFARKPDTWPGGDWCAIVLNKHNQELGRTPWCSTRETAERLLAHTWPIKTKKEAREEEDTQAR